MDSIIHDYLSITWCPESLAPIRKLAAKGHNSSISKVLANFDATKAALKKAPIMDIDFLESDCVEHLMTFCRVTSKDIFQGCKYTTDDLWEEMFTLHPRNSGMFGYRKSWDMYLNGQAIGVAACGAKNGGCYISFTGAGTALLDMAKVHQQIQYLPMIRITRVDLAFDDYQGIYSVDHAFDQWKLGNFKAKQGGINPKSGWIMSDGTLTDDGDVTYEGGRTFTVGKRINGKMCRIYEKGKQQGKVDSNWTRWEVELRSKDREIPLDILLRPEDYFVGAYPVLAFVQMYVPVEQVTRVTTRKKKVKTVYDNSVIHARRSVGKLINVMRSSREMSDSEIVAALTSIDPCAVPSRLKQANGAFI